MSDNLSYLDFSEEVHDARTSGKAILALESTIITHGMPYPQNVEMAVLAEESVRNENVVPATIAVVNGKIKVGLSEHELDLLAQSGLKAAKISRRDIPFHLKDTSMGGTTVAATMIIAAMAGIKVFATGGIGGVHRGAENSMDVSADLQELARTNVAVVCAGPKSILDIGLTLEYLETHGIAVVGYQTDELPAFFTRQSGFAVDYRLDSADDIADVLRKKWSMGLNGSMVIANPIPIRYSLDASAIEHHIEAAIQEAEALGIQGKELTPFLLARVQKLTDGNSLKANIELMLNNTRLGAHIATALK